MGRKPRKLPTASHGGGRGARQVRVREQDYSMTKTTANDQQATTTAADAATATATHKALPQAANVQTTTPKYCCRTADTIKREELPATTAGDTSYHDHGN